MYLGNGTLNNRKNQQHCQHKIENIGGKRNICKDRRDFKVHNIIILEKKHKFNGYKGSSFQGI
jgi:U3 small nucleolar RNA-associated protein 14